MKFGIRLLKNFGFLFTVVLELRFVCLELWISGFVSFKSSFLVLWNFGLSVFGVLELWVFV